MLWMRGSAVPRWAEMDVPVQGVWGWKESYQLSASVNNIIKHNQCHIKHQMNARVPTQLWERWPWCCDNLPSLIMDNTSRPHGKSALFVYLCGWIISNNHSSQDRVPRLSLSSRSSLALKGDLNPPSPRARSSADKTRDNTGFFTRSTSETQKRTHSAVAPIRQVWYAQGDGARVTPRARNESGGEDDCSHSLFSSAILGTLN